MKQNLKEYFGNIDIYLFDQLLKGTYTDCKSVIDIGCGSGRNLVYFLKSSYEVYGIDQSEEAIKQVQILSRQLAPDNPITNFVVSEADHIPFATNSFDL